MASIKGVTLKLNSDAVFGSGSFGVVFEAKIVETGEVVAIKKVLQDSRFRNRELQTMKLLHHPNIVALKHYFYQNGEKEGEVYLNLVLEFVPETVYKVTKHYSTLRQAPPMLVVKLYTYQMCRSLAYLHGCGICHRDIKPQNLLVDSKTNVLKLCDFGSSKSLVPGEPSVAYICSRYYRAPELIFGSTNYTCAIDLWSAGCVAGELLLGHPLFPGETGVDQLVEIIKVLGTPTKEQVVAMNPSYTEFHFPVVKAYSWHKLFKGRATDDTVDLLARMLTYEPTRRITALQSLAHPFFDELRAPDTRLLSGDPLPPLFNFTDEELRGCTDEMLEVLVPRHARNASNWKHAGASLSSGSGSGSAAAALPLGGGGRFAVGGLHVSTAATASSSHGASSSSMRSAAGRSPAAAGRSPHASASAASRDSRVVDVSLPSPTAAAIAAGRGGSVAGKPGVQTTSRLHPSVAER